MFTLNHFIWLGICAAIIGSLLFFALKFKWSKITAVRVMCLISIISELSKVFTHMTYVDSSDTSKGMVIETKALPFHLCSLFIFAFFFLALSKNEGINNKVISFFVPVGLFGALLAIIIANNGVAFNTPYTYQCFVYHAGMIWLALYYIITKQVDLGLKAYIRNVALLFSLAIIMIWVNGALYPAEVNFFFLVKPPVEGLPFLNLSHGWYVYFAHICSTGFLLETLVSLPFIITERRQKKRNQIDKQDEIL